MIGRRRLQLPVLFLLHATCVDAQSVFFPLGGQRGTTVEVAVENYYSSDEPLFCCDELKGSTRYENERTFLTVDVEPAARLGIHKIVIFNGGSIARPISFQVHAEPAVSETGAPHNTASKAQMINYPVVVNGKISEPGERDFYAIEVTTGQSLLFEVTTAAGLVTLGPNFFNNPELSVGKPTTSWFGQRHVTRHKCKDESKRIYFPKDVQIPIPHSLPRLACRFDEAGWCLVDVGSLDDSGGDDKTYQLRIAKADPLQSSGSNKWSPRKFVHPDPRAWRERDFEGSIQADRLGQIWSRAVEIPRADENEQSDKTAGDRDTMLEAQLEVEPNDDVVTRETQQVTVPALVAGSIDHPGDVDHFWFEAKAGQALAFAIRTPEISPPYFSPQLSILDDSGQLLLKNLYRYVGGDGDDWGKSLEAKTLYTLERDGVYHLQIRDLTARRGDPEFKYQVLIRLQIPHVGNLAAKTFTGGGSEFAIQHLYLRPGEAKQVAVVCEQEEGFDGQVAIQLENLPEGVHAHPSLPVDRKLASQPGQVYEERATENIDRFRPVRKIIPLVVLASADAPHTSVPSMIRFRAVPILKTKQGKVIPFQEIPLMVIR